MSGDDDHGDPDREPTDDWTAAGPAEGRDDSGGATDVDRPAAGRGDDRTDEGRVGSPDHPERTGGRNTRKRQRATERKPLADRMAAALTEVRREGYKAAVLYGAIDAALVALVVNFVVRFVEPSFLPATVPLPAAVVERFDLAVGAVNAGSVVGGGLGLLTFVVEVVVRTRQPLVERFESVNPEVHEALRTARDTLADREESRMAQALYEDVIDRLGRTSAVGLVDFRRVFLTVLVVLAVSLASIQVAVVGLDLEDLAGGEPTDGGGNDLRDRTETNLQDADDILGDPENVSAGDNELEAELPSQGSGEENGTSPPAAYSTDFGGSSDVQSQEAGFVDEGRLEDAELIREYNLRIRESDDDTSTSTTTSS